MAHVYIAYRPTSNSTMYIVHHDFFVAIRLHQDSFEGWWWVSVSVVPPMCRPILQLIAFILVGSADLAGRRSRSKPSCPLAQLKFIFLPPPGKVTHVPRSIWRAVSVALHTALTFGSHTHTVFLSVLSATIDSAMFILANAQSLASCTISTSRSWRCTTHKRRLFDEDNERKVSNF